MKRAMLAIIFAVFAFPALAASTMLLLGAGNAGVTAPTYTGPADIETTITHYFGTSAASAATATAQVKAADLCSATGCTGANLCSGVKVLATGALDVSTGLYCNSASQTVTAWCSTNCVSGGTARVSALYDHLNQATIASAASYAVAPDFILSGFNSKPVWGCSRTRSSQLTATVTGVSGAYSIGGAWERNATFTSYQSTVTDNGASYAIGNTSSANQSWQQIFAVVQNNPTMSDGTGTSDFTHGHIVLFTNPSSAGTVTTYLDGSIPSGGTGSSSTGSSYGTTFSVCGYTSNFANAFMSRAWTDNTLVGSTVANSVTNQTTLPLP